MGGHLFLLPHVHSFFILFFLLIFVPTSYCEPDEDFSECLAPFSCGNLSDDLYYPFWSDSRSQICSLEGFKLQCQEGRYPIISINNEDYYVKWVDLPQRNMTIARVDLSEDVCPRDDIANTNMTGTPFSYVPQLENITLFYDCQNQITMVPVTYKITCGRNREQPNAFYTTEELLRVWNIKQLPLCLRVEVPVPRVDAEEVSGGLEALRTVLNQGFNVTYNSDSSCGTSFNTNFFRCICNEQPDLIGCPKGTSNILFVLLLAME